TAQARLHQTAQEAQARADVAQATAERALAAVSTSATSTSIPQLLGPPDDAALLPIPDSFVGRQADLAWVEGRLRAGGGGGITGLRGVGGLGQNPLGPGARGKGRQGRGRPPWGAGGRLPGRGGAGGGRAT